MSSSDRWLPTLTAALALACSGCVEVGLRESLTPFDYSEVAAPPPAEPSRGSIWPGDTPSGSFLFFDVKARGVGDLLTVRVADRMRAEGRAVTDLEKSSSLAATLNSDIGFQQFVTGPIQFVFRLLGLDSPLSDVTTGTPTNVVSSTMDDRFEGEGSTQREGRFEAVVTCRVLAELPGRVFHIRGRRAMVINHEIQYLTVEGLVRQEDIGIDNVVTSDALAEARITLDGLGVIDDKQRPGWATRVLSWLYPF